MPASELTRRIAERIQVAITSGTLGSGTHLSVQRFADEFDVSRSPVLQAMKLLCDKGLLDRQRNRGFFVSDASRLRSAVEPDMGPFEGPSEYQKLAEDWLTDQLPADVTEQHLRDRYHLTKARVTELMVRAVREGWAERKPGYGWRFLPVAKSWDTFEQIYRFRALIEPAAMLEPAFHVDHDTLAKHRRIQENMLEFGIERLPGEEILNSSSNFHEDLIRCSGNPFFHQALVRANRMRRLLEYRSAVDRQRMYRFCREHLEVIELLERGEIIEASERMRGHLSGALHTKMPVDMPSPDPADER